MSDLDSFDALMEAAFGPLPPASPPRDLFAGLDDRIARDEARLRAAEEAGERLVAKIQAAIRASSTRRGAGATQASSQTDSAQPRTPSHDSTNASRIEINEAKAPGFQKDSKSEFGKKISNNTENGEGGYNTAGVMR